MEPPPLLAEPALVRDAFAWAARLHAGQERAADGAAFLAHPVEVASTLRLHGEPPAVVAAGLLHDAVEDAALTVAELAARLGEEVAGLVAAVSEDEGIEDYGERKAALREQVATGPPAALALFAADKLAKVGELRAELARRVVGPEDARTGRRLEHYRECQAVLERHAPQLVLTRALGTALWALHQLPPLPTGGGGGGGPG